jgi:hypothetical protein
LRCGNEWRIDGASCYNTSRQPDDLPTVVKSVILQSSLHPARIDESIALGCIAPIAGLALILKSGGSAMIRRCGIFLAIGIAFGLLASLAYNAPQIFLILLLALAALFAAWRFLGALIRWISRLPALLLGAIIVLIVLGLGVGVLQDRANLIVVSALGFIVYGVCLSRRTT